MAPRNLFSEDADAASSPDPLAASQLGHTPATTPRRAFQKRELSIGVASAMRSTSPTKSIILDTGSKPGASPWRIKVTVQAEPRDEDENNGMAIPFIKQQSNTPSRTSAKRSRTTTVPLKDPDWTPTTPSRGRPRKSDAGTGRTKRKPTPARRRSARLSTEKAVNDEVEVASPQTPMSTNIAPKRKRRQSTRKSDMDVIENVENHGIKLADISVDSVNSLTNTPTGPSPLKPFVAPSRAPVTDNTRPGISTLARTSSPTKIPLGPAGWSKSLFSPLPQRSQLNLPTTQYSPLTTLAESTALEANNDDPGDEEADAQMWSQMIREPENNQEHVLPVMEPDSAESDMGDVEMVDYDVGDETMMKSMDMTIVSPSSLLSKLGMDSSLADITKPGSGDASRLSASPDSKLQQKPSPRRSSRLRSESLSNPSPKPSSPHLDVVQTTPSNQPQQSPALSFTKPDESTSIREPLPTPESDEIPTSNRPDSNLSLNDDGNVVTSPNPQEVEDREEEEEEEEETGDDAGSVNLLPTFTGSKPSPASQAQTSIPPRPTMQHLALDRAVRWQREREEVSRQARVAEGNNTMTIESDEEDQSDGELDLWQQVANHSSRLGNEDGILREQDGNSRLPKVTKQSPRGTTSTLAANLDHVSLSRIENSQEGTHKSSSDSASSPNEPVRSQNEIDISNLFKTATRSSSQYRTGLEVEENTAAEASSPLENEDTGLYLRRKVSNLLEEMDLSLQSEGRSRRSVQPESPIAMPSKSPRPYTSSPPGPGPGLGPSVTPPRSRSSFTDARAAALTYSPKKSSPLKRPLEMGESDEVEPLSSPSNNNTMTSDARQLRTDVQASKKRALEPVESTNVSGTRPSPRRPRSSLLKITQQRRARSLLQTPDGVGVVFQDVSNFSSRSRSQSSVSQPREEWEQQQQQQQQQQQRQRLLPKQEENVKEHPSLLSRLGSFISTFSFSSDPPKIVHFTWPPIRPTHHLLQKYPLLPAIHPWTTTHYRILADLYDVWKAKPHLFSPERDENAVLLSRQWTQHDGIEFANWGYEASLDPSLVAFAAVFAQLLRLNDVAEYEALSGDKVELGDAARLSVGDGAVRPWHVVVRLFTVVVGEVVRMDEAKGIKIDRSPDFKWRYGGRGWWKRGILWGLI